MSKMEVIKTYYESNMGKGLPDFSVLGWESEEAQRLRFDVLMSSSNLEDKRILDVGCGMGNLLEYMNERNVNCSYTGVDILQCMIDSAKSKNLKADFHCLDIFKDKPFQNESFDLIYASGIFNLNLGNNKEFLFNALNLFLDLSSSIVAFNLLHSDSPNKEDQYYYFHPDDVKQIVEEISDRVQKINIVEHYLQNDFTVILYKDSKISS